MRKVELSAVSLPLFKEGIICDDWKAISAKELSHFGEELSPIPNEPPSYDMKAVTKNKT